MVEDEQRIRAVAEALLTRSVQSQRSSFTQHSINRTSDIVLSEDLIAGARHHGRISNVRRFFCLFVTFDLLLTCLMWLICIMLSGDNVASAFKKQVLLYKFTTSLFDIVMAAVCRFVVLILFYALMYINHWIVIALSTAATCAFLIAKVFLFDWSQSSQPVFQVLLVISSFILAWSEAWFFDFRVIPQETQARDWLIAAGSSSSERAPLLQQFLAGPPSHYTESVANFYSPMESPMDSEDEERPGTQQTFRGLRQQERLILPAFPPLGEQQQAEYKEIGTSTLNRAVELLHSPAWTLVSGEVDGDSIFSMQLPKPDGKIMKLTGIVDIPAEDLLRELTQNIENIAQWNKTIAESRKLQIIDETMDIVYQSTTPQGGGIVGARDFIILRSWGRRDSVWISSGVSITCPYLPPRKHFTRGENGVGCWAMEPLENDETRCRFTWILNTNLKGWLPKKVIDASLTMVLTEFMQCLREHVRTLQD